VAGVAVRAVRAATQVDADERELILDAIAELVTEVLARNEMTGEDIISAIFTVTPDLASEFPAYAARRAGLAEVPLLCATEIPVPGSMPRVIRMLAHVETTRPRDQIRHVYLRGAAALRPDLPR
jgi:chorismate mutase